MDKNIKDILYKKLKKQEEDIINDIEIHKTIGFDSAASQMTEELSKYDNHPGDMGTETYDQEKYYALLKHQNNTLENIRHALKKMQNDDYGTCEQCKRDISPERLFAYPTAKTCINCTKGKISTRKNKNDRPIEEKVINPAFSSLKQKRHHNVYYDENDIINDIQSHGNSTAPQDMGMNEKIDYKNITDIENKNIGYVEDVEKIDNELYKKQL